MAVAGRERRRQPRARKAAPPDVLVTILNNPAGRPEDLHGRLVDISEGGVGVELPKALAIGTQIRVRGELAGGPYRHCSDSLARVSWCVAGVGHFKAGLAILQPTPKEDDRKTSEAAPDPPLAQVPDYYDIMQLSPRADRDTVDRVFRLLAQRYHPDNQETGNADLFRILKEAHEILSDPVKRTEYDVRLGHYQKVRWQVFDKTKAARGPEAERRLRIAILHLLYTVRRNDPNQPSLAIPDLADLLGHPREHLTFALWYLKESGLVTRGDNSHYAITARGVDAAEAVSMTPAQQDRLLTAPSR